MDAKTKKALAQAKDVEQHKLLPPKKVVELYEDGFKTLEKAKKALKPEWFIKDIDKKRKKV